MILTSAILAVYITVHYDLKIFFNWDDKESFSQLIYCPPWVRYGAYGVGSICGLAYFEFYTQEENNFK